MRKDLTTHREENNELKLRVEELEIENEFYLDLITKHKSLNPDTDSSVAKKEKSKKEIDTDGKVNGVKNEEEELDKEIQMDDPVEEEEPLKANNTLESFGEISDIEKQKDVDKESNQDIDHDDEVDEQEFLNGRSKGQSPDATYTSPALGPTSKPLLLSDIMKRSRDMRDENDDSLARADSLLTNDVSMTQMGRPQRNGLYLLEEYFLMGIGSHHRKSISNHLSNSVLKYQLGGIYHHPGKR